MKNEKEVCFITCVNDEAWYEESLLYLRHLTLPADMTATYLPVRGASSMAAGYNRAMEKSDAKYKVYLHQDTFVVNRFLVSDLLRLFTAPAIGMVGVIGCRALPKSGIWWDGRRTYGRVLHACEAESVVDSELNEPHGACVPVEAADGLFLATQYDIPWRDDLFTGFHFYDTSQCMEFKRRGYRVVVPNQTEGFWCIHCPVEKPLDPKYKGYQKIFLEEYGDEPSPEV